MDDQHNGQDAVFHITHWKAGSMWVNGVLKFLARDRFVVVKNEWPYIEKETLRPGGVYSPIYLGKQKFLEQVGDLPHRRIIVIRDLRDTLVSWYFSLRYSHPTNGFVSDQRASLEAMSTEEALISLMEGRLDHMKGVQSSWLGDSGLLVRYEDLIADEFAAYARISQFCGFDVSEEALKRIIVFNSFEDRTGRKKGDEDLGSHRRKGIAGDWRNHFTERVTDAFKTRYGEHLVDTGYETSLDW